MQRIKQLLGQLCSGPWGPRALVALALALAFSYLPYRLSDEGGNRKLDAMQAELARTKREIVKRRADNESRRAFVHSLKNDTRAVEEMAREKLQMLYPHEKSFRIEGGGE